MSTCKINVHIQNPKNAFELSTKWKKNTVSTHEEIDGNFLLTETVLEGLQHDRQMLMKINTPSKNI